MALLQGATSEHVIGRLRKAVESMNSDRARLDFHRGRAHELIEILPRIPMVGSGYLRKLSEEVEEISQGTLGQESPIYSELRADLARLQIRLVAVATAQEIEMGGDLPGLAS